MKTAKIAVIGDLHGAWDDWDVQYFDQSDYECLLFTGDLGSGIGAAGVQVARSIARLAKPALLMPGNNDVDCQPEIQAEFLHQQGLIRILKAGGGQRSPVMSRSAGRVDVCGFSLHPLELSSGTFTVLAGRPYSMGGPSLSFGEHLARNYGVNSLAASVDRLVELVDQAPTGDLLFLSHNGPLGLGSHSTDLWGCDFRESGGDWGDPDLRAALEHAEKIGKNVLAVVGGHMHWRTQGGAMRRSRVRKGGTLFVNPAQVPRIFSDREGPIRSHLCLELSDSGVRCDEVKVRLDF